MINTTIGAMTSSTRVFQVCRGAYCQVIAATQAPRNTKDAKPVGIESAAEMLEAGTFDTSEAAPIRKMTTTTTTSSTWPMLDVMTAAAATDNVRTIVRSNCIHSRPST